MKLDLHTHMNGNGPNNRLDNAMALAQMAKSNGYDGLMLGCHDWVVNEEMADFIRQKYGLIVVRGAEITTDAGHILALNIPEITDPIHGNSHAPVPHAAAIAEIHRLGGKAIVSHPYPEEYVYAGTKYSLNAMWDLIDGVEISNFKAFIRHQIKRFDWFTPEENWILTSDSDCHPWEGDVMDPRFVTEIDPAVFGELV